MLRATPSPRFLNARVPVAVLPQRNPSSHLDPSAHHLFVLSPTPYFLTSPHPFFAASHSRLTPLESILSQKQTCHFVTPIESIHFYQISPFCAKYVPVTPLSTTLTSIASRNSIRMNTSEKHQEAIKRTSDITNLYSICYIEHSPAVVIPLCTTFSSPPLTPILPFRHLITSQFHVTPPPLLYFRAADFRAAFREDGAPSGKFGAGDLGPTTERTSDTCGEGRQVRPAGRSGYWARCKWRGCFGHRRERREFAGGEVCAGGVSRSGQLRAAGTQLCRVNGGGLVGRAQFREALQRSRRNRARRPRAGSACARPARRRRGRRSDHRRPCAACQNGSAARSPARWTWPGVAERAGVKRGRINHGTKPERAKRGTIQHRNRRCSGGVAADRIRGSFGSAQTLGGNRR